MLPLPASNTPIGAYRFEVIRKLRLSLGNLLTPFGLPLFNLNGIRERQRRELVRLPPSR
jgi:hypothetical protein